MFSSKFYFKCSVLLRFFLCYSSNPPTRIRRRLFLAGTRLLGRLSSRPSLQQVGLKTNLEHTNALKEIVTLS